MLLVFQKMLQPQGKDLITDFPIFGEFRGSFHSYSMGGFVCYLPGF